MFHTCLPCTPDIWDKTEFLRHPNNSAFWCSTDCWYYWWDEWNFRPIWSRKLKSVHLNGDQTLLWKKINSLNSLMFHVFAKWCPEFMAVVSFSDKILSNNRPSFPPYITTCVIEHIQNYGVFSYRSLLRYTAVLCHCFLSFHSFWRLWSVAAVECNTYFLIYSVMTYSSDATLIAFVFILFYDLDFY